MRWNKKQEPDIDDERIIKKFLIFPKNIGGEVRWLEPAKIRQVCIRMYNPFDGEWFGSWEDTEWVDK